MKSARIALALATRSVESLRNRLFSGRAGGSGRVRRVAAASLRGGGGGGEVRSLPPLVARAGTISVTGHEIAGDGDDDEFGLNSTASSLLDEGIFVDSDDEAATAAVLRVGATRRARIEVARGLDSAAMRARGLMEAGLDTDTEIRIALLANDDQEEEEALLSSTAALRVRERADAATVLASRHAALNTVLAEGIHRLRLKAGGGGGGQQPLTTRRGPHAALREGEPRVILLSAAHALCVTGDAAVGPGDGGAALLAARRLGVDMEPLIAALAKRRETAAKRAIAIAETSQALGPGDEGDLTGSENDDESGYDDDSTSFFNEDHDDNDDDVEMRGIGLPERLGGKGSTVTLAGLRPRSLSSPPIQSEAARTRAIALAEARARSEIAYAERLLLRALSAAAALGQGKGGGFLPTLTDAVDAIDAIDHVIGLTATNAASSTPLVTGATAGDSDDESFIDVLPEGALSRTGGTQTLAPPFLASALAGGRNNVNNNTFNNRISTMMCALASLASLTPRRNGVLRGDGVTGLGIDDGDLDFDVVTGTKKNLHPVTTLLKPSTKRLPRAAGAARGLPTRGAGGTGDISGVAPSILPAWAAPPRAPLTRPDAETENDLREDFGFPRIDEASGRVIWALPKARSRAGGAALAASIIARRQSVALAANNADSSAAMVKALLDDVDEEDAEEEGGGGGYYERVFYLLMQSHGQMSLYVQRVAPLPNGYAQPQLRMAHVYALSSMRHSKPQNHSELRVGRK